MTDTIADGRKPIPMMLFCPKCGVQHIDARTPDWDNPPHKSHLCRGCGCIWRPADVPTEGVGAIQTRGSKDTVFYNAASSASVPAELVERVARAIAACDNEDDWIAWDHNQPSSGKVYREYARAAIASIPPAGRVEELEALVALADAADKCAEAPHFIVQPFLSVFRKHGETIARARAALRAQAKDSK